MRAIIATAAALTLAACAQQSAPAQDAAAPAPAPEQRSAEDLATCNGADYADAVGSFLVAGAAGPGEINVDDLPDPHRVMEPGKAYTMEFVPERLILEVDGTGRILDVRCG